MLEKERGRTISDRQIFKWSGALQERWKVIELEEKFKRQGLGCQKDIGDCG